MQGCFPIRSTYDYGPECTRELVEEVAKQLATRTKRDTDFPEAIELAGENMVAIVQNGQNRKVSLNSLASSLGVWLGVDKIKEALDNITVSVRYGDTQYWNEQTGYVPDAGEIIIYSDYQQVILDGQVVNIPGIKVGSGNGYVQDLGFMGQKESEQLISHIANTEVHVTPEDRLRWDNKLDINDDNEVVNGALIFIRTRV